MDAFIPIHRKVYDGAVHHGRGLLRIVVSRVSFGLRGRQMVHRRTAAGRAVPDLGVFSGLSQCPVAVGRALIVQRVLVAQPVAPALRANLVFTSDGLLRRFEVLFARSVSWDAPPGDLLTIGDGVVMAPNATLDTTSLTSTTVITLGHVRIENNVKIGDGAEIRHGAHIAEDAKVCAGAGCSTYVPRASTYPSNREAVDTVVRCTDGKDAYPLPLLTFLVLMPLVHFVCALPAVSLLLRAPCMLRRRPVVFGLSVLGAALLEASWSPARLD